jgi:hypothetical protein
MNHWGRFDGDLVIRLLEQFLDLETAQRYCPPDPASGWRHGAFAPLTAYFEGPPRRLGGILPAFGRLRRGVADGVHSGHFPGRAVRRHRAEPPREPAADAVGAGLPADTSTQAVRQIAFPAERLKPPQAADFTNPVEEFRTGWRATGSSSRRRRTP